MPAQKLVDIATSLDESKNEFQVDHLQPLYHPWKFDAPSKTIKNIKNISKALADPACMLRKSGWPLNNFYISAIVAHHILKTNVQFLHRRTKAIYRTCSKLLQCLVWFNNYNYLNLKYSFLSEQVAKPRIAISGVKSALSFFQSRTQIYLLFTRLILQMQLTSFSVSCKSCYFKIAEDCFIGNMD